jgi:hypothetical protein
MDILPLTLLYELAWYICTEDELKMRPRSVARRQSKAVGDIFPCTNLYVAQFEVTKLDRKTLIDQAFV